jgi:hypothetical protein
MTPLNTNNKKIRHMEEAPRIVASAWATGEEAGF